MKKNHRHRKIFILNETDFRDLSVENFEPDPKLVKLFKSKSPWENDNAIAQSTPKKRSLK